MPSGQHGRRPGELSRDIGIVLHDPEPTGPFGEENAAIWQNGDRPRKLEGAGHRHGKGVCGLLVRIVLR